MSHLVVVGDSVTGKTVVRSTQGRFPVTGDSQQVKLSTCECVFKDYITFERTVETRVRR